MKFSHPFPNGYMAPELKAFGFEERDIMDIRETILKEIKRQNDATKV